MSALVPLRCECGNAVLRPRLEHEVGATEIVVTLCPECDDGDFEETFYGHRTLGLLTYEDWMKSQGLEP